MLLLLLVMVLVRMNTDNKDADRNMGIMYWPGKITKKINKNIERFFGKIFLSFLSELLFRLCHCEFILKEPEICFKV